MKPVKTYNLPVNNFSSFVNLNILREINQKKKISRDFLSIALPQVGIKLDKETLY